VYVNSLISVVCQCSMITASTGNMAEEVFNVLIVCLKKKYRFRHRYRFKTTGLAPVSEKTQTIPIPTYEKTFAVRYLGSGICHIQVMQCDILDYLLLFVDIAFGQRHILLCFQVELRRKDVTATLSLQRHSTTTCVQNLNTDPVSHNNLDNSGRKDSAGGRGRTEPSTRPS